MYICYDGITLTMLTLDVFEQDVVLDDSKTDKLYDRFLIKGTFLVNGQVEPRLTGEPPVSYTTISGSSAGGSSAGGFVVGDRNVLAAGARPPGQPNPASPRPPSTDGARRQLGVQTDPLANTAPYAAFNYTPGFGSPAFTTDLTLVPILVPAPNSPPLTEVLIRKRLTQPRGQLFVFSGTGVSPTELLLQSPGWGIPCDAKNGPFPLYCNIIQVHGDAGTFIVEWACETFVNEQDRTSNRVRGSILDPLLSNRFSMSHILDDSSWLTIVVRGTAMFDVGILQTRGINPDNYRPQLFLPVPQGFVRGNIEVEGLPGMEGVNYGFVDKQMPVNFAAGPYANATKISAEHRQYLNTDNDMLKGILGPIDSILNRRWLRRESDKELRDAAIAEHKAKANYYNTITNRINKGRRGP